MLDENVMEATAENELKRADHLIYVTLKYTRSCDVIKSVITRLISAYDLAIIDALTFLKKKNKIKKIPLTPISRAEELRTTHKKLEMINFINSYFKLRFIDRAEYTKKEEFKRHVTLTVMQNDEGIEVNIDNLHDYFNTTKEFVEYIREKFA